MTSKTYNSLGVSPQQNDSNDEAESALILNLEKQGNSKVFQRNPSQRRYQLAMQKMTSMRLNLPHHRKSSSGGNHESSTPGTYLTPTDQLFNYADQVQQLFDDTEEEEDNDIYDDKVIFDSDEKFLKDQYRRRSNSSLNQISSSEMFDEEAIQAPEIPSIETPLLNQNSSKSKKSESVKKARSFGKKLNNLFLEITSNVTHFILYVLLLRVFPLLFIAYVLFNYMENPRLDFLPTDASLSWWLIFICLQIITFQLAKCILFVVLKLSFNRRIMLNIVGPFITVLITQSSGWPFLTSTWGILGMILLHGPKPIVFDWLYKFGIPMFSSIHNPDYGLLQDPLYLQILMSLSLVGLLAGVKRTYIAMILGRRMYLHFKPQVDDLIIYMDLIAQVADLAVEVSKPEFLDSMNIVDPEEFCTLTKQREVKDSIIQKVIGENRENQHKIHESFEDDESKDNSRNREIESNDVPNQSASETYTSGDSTGRKVDWKLLQQTVKSSSERTFQEDGMDTFENAVDETQDDKNIVSFDPSSKVTRTPSSLSRESSKSKIPKIKDMLDKWTEPDNRFDDAVKSPSIPDIFRFNQVASLLEVPFPFGESFGAADTRDNTIKSSLKIYKLLQKIPLTFDPDVGNIPYDVIGSLAYDKNGELFDETAKTLVRLFRPDDKNELSQLAFVQSCDWIYRRLRFLRASMCNSTRIDRVLESMFNVMFYFVVTLIVMSILQMNPKGVLMTISTLILSVAFAIGPSIAKYIEGVLLIALRRPFDIGDRIAICASENIDSPTFGDTWFVEDITLTTTTLRYAKTNEVSTVINHSIAASRIVNYARSSNALVNLSLRIDFKASKAKVDSLQSSIQNYISRLPRVWSNMVFFRVESLDFDTQYILYTMRFTHVKTWQDMAVILRNKGDLEKYCVNVAEHLGIAWSGPPGAMKVMLQNNPTGGSVP